MTTRRKRIPNVWLWAVVLALVALGYYPTLGWLVTSWLGNPYYSHGFLVPFISLSS